MTKKQYSTPIWTNNVLPGIDINIGGSQETLGWLSRFEFDEDIALDDLNRFLELCEENVYGETVVDTIDANNDSFISETEFYDWYNSQNPKPW